MFDSEFVPTFSLLLCVLSGRQFPSHTVCDQKSTLFRFQNIISHFKNKFSQIFERRKTGHRRNSPQNYCAEASKILLSSHLQAAKFEKPFNTIWNTFVANGTALTKSKSGSQKTVTTRWKISAEKSAKWQIFEHPEPVNQLPQLQTVQDSLALYDSTSSCRI